MRKPEIPIYDESGTVVGATGPLKYNPPKKPGRLKNRVSSTARAFMIAIVPFLVIVIVGLIWLSENIN